MAELKTKGKMTAGALTAVLRRHYLPESKPPGGLFATEIQAPGASLRRADALWMPLVSSRGEELIGHELKVSRADVVVELQDHTKCEPWFQFCGRWWLVVADPSLVEGLEVPEAWGIMAPPSGRRTRSMTILRAAPALKPRNPAPAIQRLLAWSYFRDRDRIRQLEIAAERHERHADRLQDQLDEIRSGGEIARMPQARLVLRLVTELQRTGAQIWDDEAAVRIAQVISDAETVERGTQLAAQRLQHLISMLDDPMGYARKAVKDALKLIEEPALAISATTTEGTR